MEDDLTALAVQEDRINVATGGRLWHPLAAYAASRDQLAPVQPALTRCVIDQHVGVEQRGQREVAGLLLVETLLDVDLRSLAIMVHVESDLMRHAKDGMESVLVPGHQVVTGVVSHGSPPGAPASAAGRRRDG